MTGHEQREKGWEVWQWDAVTQREAIETRKEVADGISGNKVRKSRAGNAVQEREWCRLVLLFLQHLGGQLTLFNGRASKPPPSMFVLLHVGR